MQQHDLNDADVQRDFDIIPDGTIAELQIKVRPGNSSDDGYLRTSNDGNSQGLDLELTVVAGEYAKRKLWTLLTLDGKTDGHAEAARISRSKIRAILESARGIMPDDQSDTAKAARRMNHYGELNGLRFIGRIGVQPAQNGFKAKNTLDLVITPDRTGNQSSRWPSSRAPKGRLRRALPGQRRSRGRHGQANGTGRRMAAAGNRRRRRRCAQAHARQRRRHQ